MYFINLCCIIVEGNYGKNFLNRSLFYHIIVLFGRINGNKIPLGVVNLGGL
jgi:hypothetical protein